MYYRVLMWWKSPEALPQMTLHELLCYSWALEWHFIAIYLMSYIKGELLWAQKNANKFWFGSTMKGMNGTKDKVIEVSVHCLISFFIWHNSASLLQGIIILQVLFSFCAGRSFGFEQIISFSMYLNSDNVHIITIVQSWRNILVWYSTV